MLFKQSNRLPELESLPEFVRDVIEYDVSKGINEVIPEIEKESKEILELLRPAFNRFNTIEKKTAVNQSLNFQGLFLY